MKAKPLLLLLIMSVIVCGLTACGSAPSGPMPTSTSANSIPPLSSPPVVSSDPECDTHQLETWLGRSKENTRGFIDAMNTSAKANPQQAVSSVAQLSSFRNVLTRLTVPHCAQDEQAMIFGMMDNTLSAFNDYVAGRKKDIAVDVANANTLYGSILQRQKQLEDLLNVKLTEKK